MAAWRAATPSGLMPLVPRTVTGALAPPWWVLTVATRSEEGDLEHDRPMNIRMTIGRKLLGMSVLGAILTLAVGVAGYWGMQSISRTTHDMLAQEAQIARHSARLRAHVLGLRRYEKDMFINLADARKVDDYEKKFQVEHRHLTDRLGDLRGLAARTEDKDRVEAMSRAFKEYSAGVAEVVAGIRAGMIKTTQEANIAITKYKDAVHRLEKVAEDWASDANAQMIRAEDLVKAQIRRSLTTLAALALASVVAGLSLGALIARGISAPLRHMGAVLKVLAEGDLTKRLDYTSRDEVGETARSFNTFIDIGGDVERDPGPGRLARGDGGDPGGDDGHREAERRPCSADEPARRESLRGCREGWGSGRLGGGGHGRDQALVEADRGHHHDHRRDCLPDEPPGPQRRRGGRAGGRAGTRLRGG